MTVAQRLITHGLDASSVRTRAIDRAAYAADASHYLLTPQAVITADSELAVARILAACSAERLPLTFRSGGTSLSGQAGGSGVLVDVRRGFRRIDVLDDGLRVRVSPGTTVRAVNAALLPHGRILGPDPASEAACTIGGVVANNSSGMACGTEGNAYRTLESLRFILPSGTVVDTADTDADARLAHDEPDLHSGLSRLATELRSSAHLRSEIERLFAIKNTMGYGVNAFLDYQTPAEILGRLIVGSEGTLAFVASATFHTLPRLPHAATALMVLPHLDAATDVLPTLISSGPAAVELLDTRSLQVAARQPRAVAAITNIDLTTQAALLVEYQASSPEELGDLVATAGPLLNGAQPTSDSATRADLWHIRKGLYATVAGARRSGTTALLEDIAVPVPSLTATCNDLNTVFAKYGYEDTVIFGHAKDGNIHFMLNEDFGDIAGVQRYAAFTDTMVDIVLEHRGTLKAEHGTGRVMAPYVERQYGPALYAVMRELKTLCDPHGVLNPGVIITDDHDAHLQQLKQVPSVEPEIDRCVECGFCEPVCPSRDLTLTPRQRIVARRAEVSARTAGDRQSADAIRDDFRYDAIETCAADGMCQTACPVGIDTGSFVRGVRAGAQGRIAQSGGRSAARHWKGVTRIAAGGMTAAKSAPRLATSSSDIARKVVGEDIVPQWSSDLPEGGSPRRGRPEEAAEVLLMPSCTGAIFGGSASAADAFVQLCERAGVRVRIPDAVGSLCCAMPWSSKGLTDGAALMAQRLATEFRASSPSDSVTIVTDAASCTEGLMKSLPDSGFTIEDAVPFVARKVLPRLQPRTIVQRLALHPTCSSTRSGSNEALRALAEAVAEEVFVPPSWGCCGFAGDRGLLHPELTDAATRAQAEEVRDFAADAHASCNRTCELGMSRATGATYQHVLTLLERATR